MKYRKTDPSRLSDQDLLTLLVASIDQLKRCTARRVDVYAHCGTLGELAEQVRILRDETLRRGFLNFNENGPE